MTDGIVQLPPTVPGGPRIDTSELVVNGVTVERQRVSIGDPNAAGGLAVVKVACTPATAADPALVVAVSPGTAVTLMDATVAITGGPLGTASTQLFQVDTSDYNSIAVQLTGQWIGAVIFQTSNDASTWFPLWGWTAQGDVTPVDRACGPDLITLPNEGRYFQAITDPTFIGSVSWVAYQRQQEVELFPTQQVTFDPAAPVPMGGRTVSGVQTQVLTDALGAIRTADAAGPFTGVGIVTGQIPILLDTSGYQSVSVQITAGTSTIQFEGSNDGVTWLNVYGYGIGGYYTAPVGNISVPGLWVFSCMSRYFRCRVSAYNSVTLISAYLRSQPQPTAGLNVSGIAGSNISQSGGVQYMNVSQVGGSAVIQSGGLQAFNLAQVGGSTTAQVGIMTVGGNVNVGAFSTANPVVAGGVDGSGLARRILTDIKGAQVIVGPDPNSDPGGIPVGVAISPQTSVGIDSIYDLLTRILQELRLQTIYIKELPPAINGNFTFRDSDESFRDDPSFLSN